MKNSAETMVFQKVGGTGQLQIKSFADLKHLLLLDEALWAATSADVRAFRAADKEFMEFLDSDCNGIIRTDEVKNAARFLLAALKDGSGFENASGEVFLAALQNDTPAYQAAKELLPVAGKTDAESLSIEEIRSAAGCGNCSDAKTGEIMDLIRRCNDGDLSAAGIGKFKTEAAKFLEWKKAGESRQLFGAQTAAFFELFSAVKSAIDDYFKACETLKFRKASGNPGPAAEETALEKLPPAPLSEGLTLDFSSALNPVWKKPLLEFCHAAPARSYLQGTVLTADAWEELKRDFDSYGAWRNDAVPGKYEKEDPAALSDALNSAALAEIEAKAAALDARSELLKTALYQKYLKEFLNNFVNFSSLFENAAPSLLQLGTLVLDGRRFTLTTPVPTANHKRIASMSDICTLYVDVYENASSVKQRIAAAVTAGNSAQLFPGKLGIFFGADGKTYTAEVAEIIEQPVSVGEAVKAPFLRFGSYLSSKAEKFFAAQSSAEQKNLDKAIDSTVNAAPKPAQTPSVSGAMVLAGGGIGIAALGSSVAFIAKSLAQVSFWHIAAVLFGIMLIFGGPMIIAALCKLRRRNLAMFLEAEGIAANARVHLSSGIGRSFTFAPERPGEAGRRRMRFLRILFWIAAVLILLAGAFYAFCKFCELSAY